MVKTKIALTARITFHRSFQVFYKGHFITCGRFFVKFLVEWHFLFIIGINVQMYMLRRSCVTISLKIRFNFGHLTGFYDFWSSFCAANSNEY